MGFKGPSQNQFLSFYFYTYCECTCISKGYKTSLKRKESAI